MNDAPADDLIVSAVLFVIVLLVSSVVFALARLALARWGPREPGPSMDERARSAVLQLQSVGVDVPGLLGEWSPVEHHAPHPVGTRR